MTPRKTHQYRATITWTGNKGEGTTDYRSYERSHVIHIENKPDLQASSDTPFRGDGSKHNPEDLMLSALSACHMLWYLHLCANHGIVVTGYTDQAEGSMIEYAEGGGHFTEVTLHPRVTIQNAEKQTQALELHTLANQKCFMANSVKFPVKHLPEIQVSA